MINGRVTCALPLALAEEIAWLMPPPPFSALQMVFATLWLVADAPPVATAVELATAAQTSPVLLCRSSLAPGKAGRHGERGPGVPESQIRPPTCRAHSPCTLAANAASRTSVHNIFKRFISLTLQLVVSSSCTKAWARQIMHKLTSKRLGYEARPQAIRKALQGGLGYLQTRAWLLTRMSNETVIAALTNNMHLS